ncbi:MAG: GAF sensor protein [Candidatus Omnitrophica bacterium CG11_big_fil_rev_8_21_14_0_20_63_9]|nr:MAG: GAF sensor protein [Candidatus Omnitrophica bacterium CG11_big_fil_rev_8_21_14_0_20_63_9]
MSTPQLQVLRQIIETVNSTLELSTVFEEILKLVSQVTEADACLLYLLDDAAQTLTLHACRPSHPENVGRITLQVGEGLTGFVAKERRPMAIDRRAFDDPRFKMFQQLPEDRYEAFLSVPVSTRGRLIGVINVQHRRVHHYDTEVVALAETIGQLVGGAIANARLYEAARQRRRELDTLAQVSEAVVSERYLDEILQLTVTMTAQLMGSKICSLMLLDEAKQTLVIRATQALSPAYRNKPPIRVGQSISGRAVKERRPISVLDVAKDRGYMFPEIARREGLRSLLSVPMVMQDRVIGVLNCYTAEPHRFSNDEIRVLYTIANQAAVAIEHTRVLDQALALQKSLDDRKLIEKAKGILIEELRCSEEEAFRLLQKQSMAKRRSMREIAEAILLADELKAPHEKTNI